ncbi:GntR family transcriptional regulator [Lichenihabitans psoromatis]|uniref:GntR family transcriptional regulator n=1 Tax=Lichenihabitans psoromatis TaxID=2528642 RepID=UPI0010359592|nr:GntR family transcriptional regulator [Lichenihabitans psoromatis]
MDHLDVESRNRTVERAAKAARPASRTSSASTIAATLRDEIVGMTLLPGTPLQDRVLSERFGVSRTPIREATLRLADEGLVDIFPQSGTFVSRIPVAAIPEAVLVREALEGLTVESAAARGSTAGLDEALALQRVAMARGDQRKFHEADEAFHEAVAALSGHPGIWRLLRTVKMQLDRARRLTLPVLGRMDQVVGEHERIRDAVAAADVRAARAAMTLHLNVVIPDVAWLQDRYPDYFA